MSTPASYRPWSFDEVTEQAAAVATLKGHMKSPSGLYLLHGPRGTGKTTLARIFARSINCQAPNTCTKRAPCTSCEVFGHGNHPDITEQNGADARGIDDVRALIDQSKYHPRMKFRVFILDEIHQLTPQAQEALLKPFEEPSRTTVWILCTTNPEKLKPTIVSRSRNIPLARLTEAGIRAVVQQAAAKEGVQVPDDVMKAIVEVADGHARESLTAFDTYLAALAGGGAANIERVAKQIQSASPINAAIAYVIGFLKNAPAQSFQAARMAESKQRLVEDIIDLLRAMIFKVLCPPLFADHRHASRMSKVALTIQDVPWMSALLDEHIKALAELKSYTTAEFDVIDSLVTRCCVIKARMLS